MMEHREKVPFEECESKETQHDYLVCTQSVHLTLHNLKGFARSWKKKIDHFAIATKIQLLCLLTFIFILHTVFNIYKYFSRYGGKRMEEEKFVSYFTNNCDYLYQFFMFALFCLLTSNAISLISL